MSGGFPLQGYDPNNPTPGQVREIRFAQGALSGGSSNRPVVMFCNKVSAGSETVNTLGDPIADQDDCVARFGYRSEGLLMYRSYTTVDPGATVYMVAVPEGTGASSFTWTFVNSATDTTTLKIMCIGETVQVPVASGDSISTIASAVSAAINAQIFWPVTASPSSGVVTVTASNVGTRGDSVTTFMRASFVKNVTTTVTKSAITPGTTDDDQTTAIGLLANVDLYYQINPKGTIGAATATDNGLGEHIAQVITNAWPVNGKDAQVHFGFCGTQAQATTVAVSAGVNSSLAHMWHAKNSDWTPAMIAAHCCAVKRSKEVGHAGANLTDYGKRDGEIFRIPAPFASTDRLTPTEVSADLNNGVSPIGFTRQGQAFVIRSITTRSLTGTVQDYRVREGHIPSAIHKFWSDLSARYFSVAQPFVAADPKATEKPIQGVTYPSSVKSLVSKLIDDSIDGTPGGPLLDPTFRDDMKNTIQVLLTSTAGGGISCKACPVAVKHLNSAAFLLLESSSAT